MWTLSQLRWGVLVRDLSGKKLVLATHNAGKIAEMVALLAPYRVSILSAAEFGLSAPEETATDFIGNARIKARFVSQQTGLPALADDSGIEIDALNGAPGIHTADWAETTTGRDFDFAMRKTWELVELSAMKAPHAARFRCAIVVAWPDGAEEVFEGAVEGFLVWPPRGPRGHGYDPMFQPNGVEQTFAEMLPAEKNRISHRAMAFAALTSRCFT